MGSFDDTGSSRPIPPWRRSRCWLTPSKRPYQGTLRTCLHSMTVSHGFALMRNYGLPSRLLDCTESPAVAAYFSSQPDPDRDFAIWAIQKEGIRRATQDALGIVGGRSRPSS